MMGYVARLAGLLRLCLVCIFGIFSATQAQAGDGSVGDPFTSLGDVYSAPSSGRYFFDLGSGAFQADVDMSEGGGWVLVLQYVHQGGTNPALSVIGAGSDLPVLSSAGLGTDESAVSANWGHAGNAAMSQFASDIELRWYGATSGHSRIVHFSSSTGDAYVRTGTGSFTGIAGDVTPLSGHTANIPASATHFGTNQSDAALIEFPFFEYAARHWGIRGQGDRWEVDDYPDDASNDTIHRVWVRTANPIKVTHNGDSGDGSLREAIAYANANASADTISFDIDGVGPHTITLTSALPAITDANITIDATTQSGANCGSPATGSAHTLMVRLDTGSGNNPGFDGLTGNASNVTIRGLSITRMTNGISWDNLTSGLSVECSYIGLDPNGTVQGNHGAGLFLGGSNHTIGGLNAGDGNVISGNSGGGIDYENASSASIQGNAIGTDPTGTSARANGGAGIALSGTTSDVTIGGTSAAARNLISGNNGDGIHLDGVSDIEIMGNYVGLGANGSTEISNGAIGVHVDSANSITIGNGSASGRNVMGSAANTGVITTAGTFSNLTISDNYIGTDATGNTVLANGNGSSDDGIRLYGTGANVDILNTVIAGFTAEMIELWFSASITDLTLQGNKLGVGADGTTALPSGRAGLGLFLVGSGSSLTNAQIGGLHAGNGNIFANGLGLGFDIRSDAGVSSGRLIGNEIYANGDDGISVLQSGSSFAFVSNRIYNNGGLGIDISADGVTANDGGDGDAGANDGLNFPVLNAVGTDGSTTVTYDLNLDVPSHANGYRIDFFVNSSADPSGNGEGETYIGYIDVAHSGGDTNFTGSFTADQNVLVGSIISATASRKTGALNYDISSEFALNVIATSAVAPLVVTSTADTNTIGTLRYAITHANANTDEDAISFNIAGVGPHTITLGSALPDITDAGITIDGTTQSGASCGDPINGTPHTLMIRLDSGSGTAVGYHAFLVDATNVTLSGLSMTRFYDGIVGFPGANNLHLTCSYFGLAPDGTAAGNYNYGIFLGNDDTQIGGPLVGDGNVISNNQAGGIYLTGATTSTIQGNLIGTSANGSTGAGNTNDGIHISSGAAEISGNVISANTRHGVHLANVPTSLSITDNIIGLARDGSSDLGNGQNGVTLDTASASVLIGNGTSAGRNTISGNGGHGIWADDTTGLAINDNYIGTDSAGVLGRGNDGDGIYLSIPAAGTGHQSANINNNVVAANTHGIYLYPEASRSVGASSDLAITNNRIGVASNGTTALGNTSHGINLHNSPGTISVGDASGSGNIIAHNGGDGVRIATTATTAAVLGNQIHDNTNLGINILIESDPNIVTPNDSGDGDSGANDQLNFPVLNEIRADATTNVTYDFNLDVPSNADGYRVEFFRNSTADASGHGEGETYLGFIDIAHSGGDANFTGSFTAAQTVSTGAIISATATRKTGSNSYDITSEFAANIISIVAGTAELDASRSVSVYDPSATGLYMTPGNDIIVQLAVTNSGAQAADANSIELIDSVGDNVRFYNGATPEFANAIVGWSETGSNLTFTPTTDLAFSDAGSRPANFAACTYTPSAGYDPAITYICLNPKGAMAAGDPDPQFTVQYRVQIE